MLCSHPHARRLLLCATLYLGGCTLLTGVGTGEDDQDMSTQAMDMRPAPDLRMPVEPEQDMADMAAAPDMRQTCATTQLDCGDHGSCQDEPAGAPFCECEQSHTGPSCELCAEGYQDNDADGVCRLACTREDEECDGQGLCDDSSGQATCTCQQGYAQADPLVPLCDVCDTGYLRVLGGECMMDETCAGIDCGGAGTCISIEQAPACQCDEGFQDLDNDLSCSPACAPTSCSPTQQCEDSSGQIVCTSTTLYTSCQEVLDDGFTKDTFYKLHAHGNASKPWWAVCTEMSSLTPKTYLPLAATDAISNRFQVVDEVGLLSETAFWMVRIDPVTLLVDIEDFSYSHTMYYQPGKTGPEHRAPYASLKSCGALGELARRAFGKIDLRFTPFKVNDTFERSGECVDPVSVTAVSSQQSHLVRLALSPSGGVDSAGKTQCGYVSTTSRADQFGQPCSSDPSLSGKVAAPSPSPASLQLAYTDSTLVGNAPLFLTCQEVALWHGGFPSSGEHPSTLHVERRPDTPQPVLCTGPAQAPMTYEPGIAPRATYKAYLELPSSTPGVNIMHRRFGDGARIATKYERIRIDLRTSSVDITDATYTTTSADATAPVNTSTSYYGVSTAASYSQDCDAMCCGGLCPTQTFVDLTGTRFAVESAFELAGDCPVGSATPSQGDQYITLSVDGGPGLIGPELYAQQRARGAGEAQCAGAPYSPGDDRDAQYYSEDDFLMRIKPKP